jgi:hypothetical protein
MAPCAALSAVILAYWRVAGDGSAASSPAILPDAYMEIVINLGGAVTLAGPAFNGSQPPRASSDSSRPRSRSISGRCVHVRHPPENKLYLNEDPR